MQTTSSDNKGKGELERNLLIADFMGVKIGVDKYSWRPGCLEPIREEHLAYHYNWGWLMQVVEKIHSMGYEVNIGFEMGTAVFCCIFDLKENGYEERGWQDMHSKSAIESIYSAIVMFLTWYNTNKPESNDK